MDVYVILSRIALSKKYYGLSVLRYLYKRFKTWFIRWSKCFNLFRKATSTPTADKKVNSYNCTEIFTI